MILPQDVVDLVPMEDTMPTEEILRELYIGQQLSTKCIAKRFGVCYQTAHRWLVRYNIPRRTYSEAIKVRYRRDSIYKMDDSILDDWNPISAWFIGLMYADGYISKDRTRAGLVAADTAFLAQVRDVLGSNFFIQTKSTTPTLYINRTDRVEKLEQFGLHPAKTLTAEFPDVPSQFLPGFVRGFLDGDGWISVRTSQVGNRTPISGLSLGWEIASKSFADGLYNSIKHLGNVSYSIRDRIGKTRKNDIYSRIKHKHIMYAIHAHCSSAMSILDWLYQDSTPSTRFDKKYQIYLSLSVPV